MTSYAMRAENERLRAAIKDIASHFWFGDPTRQSDAHPDASFMCELVRNAVAAATTTPATTSPRTPSRRPRSGPHDL